MGDSSRPERRHAIPRDSDYFATDRQWMLNLRVDGLDAMLAALEAAGIAVTTNPDWDMPGVSRFARIHDAEGDAADLWEPDDQGAVGASYRGSM